MYKKAKLVLVGAGPGDPDLITVKGLKALQAAKIVLYDALVNKALLKHVPEDSPRIFVGKRGGVKKFDQQEINEIIVRCSLQYGHCVRLKGGDPFVFGRGAEEIAYAEQFGIETEVISGVSSAISAPAAQKIPLTKRGINESFWVITGTTRDHSFSKDITLAAGSSATVVILMGMKNLPAIVEAFISNGKAETPAAIIQNGTLPEEKIVAGPVGQLVELAAVNKMGSPAIIVVGEVVKHASNSIIREAFTQLQWMEENGSYYSDAG